MPPVEHERHAHAPVIMVWGAMAIVYVVWGSTYLAIRILALHDMPVFSTAGVRFLVAGTVLWVIGKIQTRRDPEPDPVERKHWRSAFIVGGALLLLGNGSVVYAEQTVASGIAALFVASAPMWFAIIARVFLKERIGKLAIAGLAVGFAGVGLLFLPSASSRVDPAGAFALLLAPISWTAGSLYLRKAPFPKKPLMGTAMQMLAGGIMLLAGGALTGELRGFEVADVDAESWLSLGYLILLGSLVAYTAYTWLLRHARTSLVSTYAYVNPVVAVALGAMILDEQVTPATAIAAGVIVIGVAMIVSSPSPGPVLDEAEIGSMADAPPPHEHPETERRSTPAR